MADLWLVFWWTGPVGVGIFLVCLGTFIWLLTKADVIKTQSKGQDKK